MPDKELFDAGKISIVDYKLIRGQIDAPEDFSISHVQGHHTLNVYNSGFDLEKKLAKTDFTVEITTNSDGLNELEAKGNFHFVYFFEIENLPELATANADGIISLNPALAHALASITYSTSRGILITRLQGTALQNYFLPVVSTSTLLSEK